MSDKFTTRMHDLKVSHDTAVVADLIAIWCEDHHPRENRRPVNTPATSLGVYGKKLPVLCEECEAHLVYAERRRALCPKDPKPFCAHCDTQCYRPAEAEWQRQVMRYSGPRSWRKGRTIDGIKHVLEKRKWKRIEMQRAKDDSKGTLS